MSAAERVVVTGMGLVSPLGCEVGPFFQRLVAAESGIGRLCGFEAPGLADPIGGRIPDWDAGAWLDGAALRGTSRITQYAHAAARRAMASAGLEVRDRPRGAVVFGTGFGAQASQEATYHRCFGSPGARPRPDAILQGMANATAAFLASELRLLGPSLTVLAACASANHAIGQAAQLVRMGRCELALAGGGDAPILPIVMAAWAALRILAPAGGDPARACRPFSRDRKGLVVSEGAAFLVLEPMSAARRRGAPILAEIAGYGANADGGHVTQPDPAGIGRCLRLALEDARIGPDEVGFVSSHGTGTPANDRAESRALACVLGPHARHIPVNSTKAVHGHAMGASAGFEAIGTIMSMREGLIPPTAHLDEIDPELAPLDHVRCRPRERKVSLALSNAFGFGGTNAVLVLRRFA